MSNLIPEPMTEAELAAVLHDMLHRVEEGDSLEGNIEYLLPYPDTEEEEALYAGVDFLVRGAYRIGNRQGQGGMRMIGTVPTTGPVVTAEAPAAGDVTVLVDEERTNPGEQPKVAAETRPEEIPET